MIKVYRNKQVIEFPNLDIGSAKDCKKALKLAGILYNKLDIDLYELELEGVILKSY